MRYHMQTEMLLRRSAGKARSLGHSYVGSIHLLLAMAAEPGGMGLVLRQLGVEKMRLMTNNPVKRVGLEAYGLEIVENVPIETTPNEYNLRYLQTKKERMGHWLHLK